MLTVPSICICIRAPCGNNLGMYKDSRLQPRIHLKQNFTVHGGPRTSVSILLDITELFCSSSGHKINWGKSQLMPVHSGDSVGFKCGFE